MSRITAKPTLYRGVRFRSGKGWDKFGAVIEHPAPDEEDAA